MDRVQQALRRRDEAVAMTAARDLGTAPAVIRRQGVGYRRVIAVDGALDPAAIAELVETFRDAIEAGARDIWINLATSGLPPAGALEEIAQLSAFGREFGRHTALIVPPGPAYDAAARRPELDVYDSVASAHTASR